jgi:hypothetical protein
MKQEDLRYVCLLPQRRELSAAGFLHAVHWRPSIRGTGEPQGTSTVCLLLNRKELGAADCLCAAGPNLLPRCGLTLPTTQSHHSREARHTFVVDPSGVHHTAIGFAPEKRYSDASSLQSGRKDNSSYLRHANAALRVGAHHLSNPSLDWSYRILVFALLLQTFVKYKFPAV